MRKSFPTDNRKDNLACKMEMAFHFAEFFPSKTNSRDRFYNIIFDDWMWRKFWKLDEFYRRRHDKRVHGSCELNLVT